MQHSRPVDRTVSFHGPGVRPRTAGQPRGRSASLPARVVTLLLCAGSAAGCSDTLNLKSAMELDGQMKMEGVMRVEGPIQMQVQMQGPRVEYSGVYISEALFERVDVGETTSDWVLAVFGEPTGRASLNDGTEIWKWAYVPLFEEKPLMSILSTGGEDAPTVTQSTTFLHMRSSLVIDKWRD